MLQFLRGHASSWIMKIVLGLIVASFGIWGISGLFTGKGTETLVASVGKTDISKRYLLHVLQRQVQAANQELKEANITLDQAIQMGLHTRLLDDLVKKALIEQEINDLKFAVNADSLSNIVFSDPAFKSDQGRFDKEKFKKILSNSGLTEDQYLADRAHQLLQAQFMSGITATSRPAGSFAVRLFNELFEERALILYTFDEAVLKKSTPALRNIKKEDLESYYQDQKETYKVSEKRSFTTLVLDPVLLGKKYTFSQKEIKEAYELQADNFAVPEKRDLLIFTDSTWRGAKAAFRAMEKGKSPDSSKLTKMHRITQAELSDRIGEEGFDLKKGETSDVMRTPDGYQVVKVLKVYPTHIKPLKQVRGQVIEDLRRQRAMDEMSHLIQTIEYHISGGGTLEEAAKEHKLKIVKAPLLSQNIKKKELPKGLKKNMIQTAFEQEAEETGSVVELEDGMAYIVRVDAIQPEAIQPFTKVSAQVKKDYMKKKMESVMAEKAEKIAFEGKAFTGSHKRTIWKDASVSSQAVSSVTFLGSKDYPDLTKDILSTVWELKKNHAAVITYKGKPAVALVQDISPAVAAKHIGDYKSLKNEIVEMINKDFLSQYFDALKEKHHVEIYEDQMKTLAE